MFKHIGFLVVTPPLLLAILVSGATTAQVRHAAGDRSVSETQARPGSARGSLVETGETTRGEALHAILSAGRPAHLVSETLAYRLESPAGERTARLAGVTMRATLESGVAAARSSFTKSGPSAQSITIPEDPNPPTGPSRPGERTSTSQSCATARIGFTHGVADVTYHYVYQNTVDSNGDGKKDSEPAWVLDRTEVRWLQTNVAALCE